jgi:mono/diheme cytochrome c family protein
MKRWSIALVALSLIGSVSFLAGQDGAALYKNKCSGCHGKDGEGKPALKAPALKATTWDNDKIVKHLTKGEADSKPPHNKGIAGISDEQAKAIADFVQSLK